MQFHAKRRLIYFLLNFFIGHNLEISNFAFESWTKTVYHRIQRIPTKIWRTHTSLKISKFAGSRRSSTKGQSNEPEPRLLRARTFHSLILLYIYTGETSMHQQQNLNSPPQHRCCCCNSTTIARMPRSRISLAAPPPSYMYIARTASASFSLKKKGGQERDRNEGET